MPFIALILLALLGVAHTAVQQRPVVVITGANSGVGLAATRQLAALNTYDVVMACRSVDRAEAARGTIPQGSGRDNVSVMRLDLADIASIQDFCSTWGKRPINCLCLNAGVQFSDAKAAVPRTKQGFEETIGTNHLGHFLLANLLLDNVKAAGKGRIIFTGSGVHNPSEPGGNVGSKAGLEGMRGLEEGFLDPVSMINGGPYDGDKAYKDSKLCNVATSIELARRLQSQKSDVVSCVFNPGLIPTSGLFRGLNPLFVGIFTFLTRYVFKVAVSEEEGGDRLVTMVTSPLVSSTFGGYWTANTLADFGKLVLSTPSKEAQDPEVGRRLWSLSERVLLEAKGRMRGQ